MPECSLKYAKVESENLYNSYVLGLLAIMGDDYFIKFNCEYGEGRYDVFLISHDKSKYWIVIEIIQIARVENENEESLHNRLDEKIHDAKTQIDNNQYYKE